MHVTGRIMEKTILKYLQEKGIPVNAVCGGNHKCGKCLVKTERALPLREEERWLLSDEQAERGLRLACMHEYEEGDVIAVQSDEMKAEDSLKEDNTGYRYRDGYGLITDLGTTTISMKWVDQRDGTIVHSSSFMNPQQSFGADVISRIQAQKEHRNELHAHTGYRTACSEAVRGIYGSAAAVQTECRKTDSGSRWGCNPHRPMRKHLSMKSCLLLKRRI